MPTYFKLAWRVRWIPPVGALEVHTTYQMKAGRCLAQGMTQSAAETARQERQSGDRWLSREWCMLFQAVRTESSVDSRDGVIGQRAKREWDVVYRARLLVVKRLQSSRNMQQVGVRLPGPDVASLPLILISFFQPRNLQSNLNLQEGWNGMDILGYVSELAICSRSGFDSRVPMLPGREFFFSNTVHGFQNLWNKTCKTAPDGMDIIYVSDVPIMNWCMVRSGFDSRVPIFLGPEFFFNHGDSEWDVVYGARLLAVKPRELTRNMQQVEVRLPGPNVVSL
ncbi:hypothetical protein K438DRAFT_1763711 [Mycena galopus ATCC 62051]|nr:hypothetical protein K438DRAFT_1763711 [Mycena galopus ATCC 62051]